jgi:myo-inositol 2-dehydrogenase/D-chiro-inositol 1-dehydrogenase
MLNVGLLGAGRIAGVHATAITTNPGSRLVAVSDINADAAAKLATQYGAEARTTDAILNDPKIDAILIATSTDTHSDLIERATGAGKAVLCEKPVDLSLVRAQACQKVAARNGKPVMIGFNRRFDPNFAALKAAADKGEIGKTELLSITSFDPAPPPVAYIKVSGGLFRDMMIHDFDMANFIMGGPGFGQRCRHLDCRSRHRCGGRCGYRRRDAQLRRRAHRRDQELAPRGLWL